MHELIEAIRTAVADSATPEQKAIGAQACRTILAALDAQPGTPIQLPGMPSAPPVSLSIDQVLDLVIARLGNIAAARESPAAQPAPAPKGLRIPVVRPVARRPTSAPNRRKP